MLAARQLERNAPDPDVTVKALPSHHHTILACFYPSSLLSLFQQPIALSDTLNFAVAQCLGLVTFSSHSTNPTARLLNCSLGDRSRGIANLGAEGRSAFLVVWLHAHHSHAGSLARAAPALDCLAAPMASPHDKTSRPHRFFQQAPYRLGSQWLEDSALRAFVREDLSLLLLEHPACSAAC